MQKVGYAAAVLLVLGWAVPAASRDAALDAQQLATMHQEQFQLGQLAHVRGQSASVRALGKTLMDDHLQALERLADAGQVTWPIEIDARHRQLEQELSSLEGREFDRRFVDAIVIEIQGVASALGADGTARGASSGAAGATGTSGASGSTSRAVGTSGSDAGRMADRHLAAARRLQRSFARSDR